MKSEKVLLAAAGSTFLKEPCSSSVFSEFFSKKMKIENVLPALGGNMNFANFIIESDSMGHSFFGSNASLAIV